MGKASDCISAFRFHIRATNKKIVLIKIINFQFNFFDSFKKVTIDRHKKTMKRSQKSAKYSRPADVPFQNGELDKQCLSNICQLIQQVST